MKVLPQLCSEDKIRGVFPEEVVQWYKSWFKGNDYKIFDDDNRYSIIYHSCINKPIKLVLKKDDVDENFIKEYMIFIFSSKYNKTTKLYMFYVLVHEFLDLDSTISDLIFA